MTPQPLSRSPRCTLLAVSVALFGAATAATAQAQTAPTPVASTQPASASVVDRPGFDFGMRLGYALPMGSASKDNSIRDGISGAIPIVLEAGYRFTPNITAGALFQYALAQTKNCDAGASCSASVVRLGIEGLYNFRMGTTLDPWVGLGIGYEWLNVSESAGGQSQDASLGGMEFVTLHGGADYRLSPQLALGPFLSFSLARYGSASSGSTSIDIPNTALHEWLQLGVRGTFSI
jgi:opacity protein-like surface antigen